MDSEEAWSRRVTVAGTVVLAALLALLVAYMVGGSR